MQDFQTSIGSPSASALAAGQKTPFLPAPHHPIPVDDGTNGTTDSTDKSSAASGSGADLTISARIFGFLITLRGKVSWSTLFWCSGAIIGSVLQNVYLQETGVALPIYPYFIFWSTVVPFNLVFFFALFVVYRTTQDITREMRAIPHWKFGWLGFLNCANGIFLLFANPHVPGAIQALLGPTIITIPLAMIACWLMLGHKYKWQHFAALTIILGGIFLAIYPSVFEPQEGQGASSGTVFWNAIWMIGSIPVVIASVYEEKLFGEQPVHVLFLLAWITFYQMLWILFFWWVDAIPGFGTADSVKDVFINQANAMKCTYGGIAIPDACPMCDCKNAGWNYVLFIIGYILTNFFTIGVVKYCGALFSYVVSTIVTPLTTFAFSSRALLGNNAQPLNQWAYYALGVLLVGTIAYRIAGDAIKPPHAHQSSVNTTTNNPNVPLLGDLNDIASPPTKMEPVASGGDAW